PGCTCRVGGIARDPRGKTVYLTCVLVESVLGEHDRSGTEAVGFDNIRARAQEGFVQLADLLRARAHEILVASFQLRTAAIVGVQMHRLDGSARGAVDYDDTLVEQFAEKLQAVGSAAHSLINRPSHSWTG